MIKGILNFIADTFFIFPTTDTSKTDTSKVNQAALAFFVPADKFDDASIKETFHILRERACKYGYGENLLDREAHRKGIDAYRKEIEEDQELLSKATDPEVIESIQSSIDFNQKQFEKYKQLYEKKYNIRYEKPDEASVNSMDTHITSEGHIHR